MGPRALRVLVISPDVAVQDLLLRELPPVEFDVRRLAPGGGLVAGVRCLRPAIAILDRAHERKEAVPMEVALLRDARSDVRVIAVSPETSLEDAALVELGLYYLLQASPPLRLPELVRAAARSLRRHGHDAVGAPPAAPSEPSGTA